MKKKISPKIVSLIFGVLVISFAIGFYIHTSSPVAGQGGSHTINCRAQAPSGSCYMECDNPDYGVTNIQVTGNSYYAGWGWSMSSYKVVGWVTSSYKGQWVDFEATCVKADSYTISCKAKLCYNCAGVWSCWMACKSNYGVTNIHVTGNSYYAGWGWTMTDRSTVKGMVTSSYKGQWVIFGATCVKTRP